MRHTLRRTDFLSKPYWSKSLIWIISSRHMHTYARTKDRQGSMECRLPHFPRSGKGTCTVSLTRSGTGVMPLLLLIVTRTQTEAQDAMVEVKAYVEGKLKLLVNQDKSKVASLLECDFLGFNIRGKKLRRSNKSAQQFKRRIQEITSRSRGISMRQRLLELKRYCVGWFHYFKIGLSYKEVREWDAWIRRRVRLCYWKDWKRPRKRRRMLIKLGISPREVKESLPFP